MKLIIKILPIILVNIFFYPLPVSAKSTFLFNPSFTESYYKLKGGKGSWGSNAFIDSALFSELSRGSTMFFNYDISYEETTQVVEEEGVRWADKILGQFLTFGYLHKIGKYTENKLSVLGYLEYTKGAKDEKLLDGIYNYYDIGLKNEIRYTATLGFKPMLLKGGYKFYLRRFPNYEGLYYLIYKKGPQWERNYFGNKFWLSSDVAWSAEFTSNFKIIHLWKIYADDLVMKEPEMTGEYPYRDKKRREHVTGIDIGINYEFLMWLNLSLKMKSEFRRSNQNYYDCERLVFIPNVYDYNSYSISPAFLIKASEDFSCEIGYEFNHKKYTDNLAYDESGEYTDSKLYKIDHIVKLNISFTVYKNISAVGSAYWNFSRSNTKYERAYGYNYQAKSFGIGINYEF